MNLMYRSFLIRIAVVSLAALLSCANAVFAYDLELLFGENAAEKKNGVKADNSQILLEARKKHEEIDRDKAELFAEAKRKAAERAQNRQQQFRDGSLSSLERASYNDKHGDYGSTQGYKCRDQNFSVTYDNGELWTREAGFTTYGSGLPSACNRWEGPRSSFGEVAANVCSCWLAK